MSELFPGFTTRRIATVRRGNPLRSSAAAVRRSSCCTAIRRRTRCGIGSRRASRERFTVVCSDLRGYGDSSKPDGGARPRRLLEARDGGGPGRGDARRSASRDSGWSATIAARASRIGCASIIREAVERVAVLDISPTRIMYDGTDMAFATAYYHWFFLIQPFDLPERLIGADPIYYLHKKLGGWSSGLAHLRPARARRIRALLRDPATIHATCEDYRAAATIDLEHDAADAHAARGVSAARAVGRRRAWCTGCSIRSPTGTASRATCAASRCRRGTFWPRRCRRRRWPNCRRFSAVEPCASGVPRVQAKRGQFAIIRTLGQVAQLVEQRTENPCVGGSIPPLATISRRRSGRNAHSAGPQS